ncbi:MAG TPA: DUF308 domain-containing protein [Ktedonobacterales bacterium]
MDSKPDRQLARATALRGTFALFFGIVTLFLTGQPVVALVYDFGLFAFLSGLTGLVAALRLEQSHLRSSLPATAGAIGVLAGIASFIWPDVTAPSAVTLIAMWALLSGVTEFAVALAWPHARSHPWLNAVSGALSVLFGIVLARWPSSSAFTVNWLIGVYAMLYGAIVLYHAYRLEAFHHDWRAFWTTDHEAHAA